MRRIFAGASLWPKAVLQAKNWAAGRSVACVVFGAASHRIVALALLSSLAIVHPHAGHAEWMPNGNIIAHPLLLPSVRLAPDASGGVYVSWDAGYTYSDRLVRILADGQVAGGWPAVSSNGLVLFRYPWWGYPQSVVEDGHGGALAVEEGVECAHSCGGDSHVVLATRVQANAVRAPGWTEAGITLGIGGNSKSRPQIATAADEKGGVVAAWSVAPIPITPYSPREVRAQRVDGSGRLLWGSDGVVVQPVSAAYTLAVAIVADGGGGAFVFWLDGTATRILSQHLSPAGRALWANGGVVVVDGRGSVIGAYRVVADHPTAATLAWIANRADGGTLSVTRVRGDCAGGFRTEIVAESLPANAELSMDCERAGGAVLAWSESRGSTDRAVVAQRFNHGGRPMWRRSGVVVSSARSQKRELRIVSDGTGGAYLAWGDSRPEAEVYAMHLGRAGEATRGWRVDGAPLCPPMHSLSSVELVADGARSAFVAWTDERPAPGVLYSDPVTSLTRLTPAGPSASLQPLQDVANDHGRTDIALGARPVVDLAIDGVESSVSPGTGVVRFSLANGMPASLEMIDIAGRRMWSREVGSLGAGEHSLRLGSSGWVPSGVYFVRLTQGDRVATARVAIIH